jgi:hypothetical protein
MEYTAQGPDGNTYSITGPAGASDDEVIAQIRQAVEPGKLESFARGVENNFPLANQAIAAGSAVLGDKSYSENLAEQNQAIAASKAAHPLPYDAGAVAGAVAPALIPGIGEAGIAGQAALGAAYGVGSTDVLKNPEEALKGAAVGGVTGGVLGAIMPSGEKAAEGMTDYANRKTAESMGLNPKMLGGLSQDEYEAIGSRAHAWDLDTGSTAEKTVKAQAKMDEVGEKIQAAGLGSTPLKDATPHIAAIEQHMQDTAKMYAPGTSQEVGIYQQAISNLQKPNLTFDDLQDLKKVAGKYAFDAAHQVKDTPSGQAFADVWSQYKDAMKSIIKGSPEEYQQDMSDYSLLHDLTGGLTKQLGNERAGGAPAKGFGMAGKLGGMVTGGNVPATAALSGGLLAAGKPFMSLGAATTIFNNPGAMSTAARAGAGALPIATQAVRAGSIDAVTSGIMNAIRTNPQSLGKFSKPLMQAAQTGGKDGLIATDFVLAHQYPEWNELRTQMLKNHTEDTNETQR